MIGKVNVGVLLEVDEVLRLDTVAAATRDSRAGVVRRAIRELLAREAEQAQAVAS